MDDLIKKPTWRDYLRLFRPYILIFFFALIALIYAFNLFFGDKSVATLIELNEREKALEKSVSFYLRQNATLQKEIFELSGE